MNKAILKLIMMLLVMCAAQLSNAQEPPPPPPPPGTDNTTVSDPNPTDGVAMKVGDKKDGGIVYWVDGSGRHGLIVWPNDLGIKKWAEAEQACTNLGAGWHMPSKDELDKLYKANLTLKILSSYFFFQSSTEESPGVVWKQSLSNGTTKTSYKTGAASTAAVKSF